MLGRAFAQVQLASGAAAARSNKLTGRLQSLIDSAPAVAVHRTPGERGAHKPWSSRSTESATAPDFAG
jgi:hypothetical protein